MSVLVLTALLAGCRDEADPPPSPSASPSPSPVVDQPWLSGVVDVGAKNDQPGLMLKTSYSNAGLEYGLAQFVAEKAGFTPNSIDTPSNNREVWLSPQDGKPPRLKLVIASYSITGERAGLVDFAGPYLKTSQRLLVRADETRFKLPQDVTKKHICTVDGTTSAKGMTATAAPTPDSLIAGSLYTQADFSTCVKDLRSRAADAVYTDTTILYGFTQLYPDELKVLPMVFGATNWYGIGLPKGHREDCRRLMVLIKEFLRDRWDYEFTQNLPSIVTADPGRYANDYRPSPSDVDQYSTCG